MNVHNNITLSNVADRDARIHELEAEIKTLKNDAARFDSYGEILSDKLTQAEARLASAEALLCSVYDDLEWHADDDVDPNDQCPEDLGAHTNGIIRQRIRDWLNPKGPS